MSESMWRYAAKCEEFRAEIRELLSTDDVASIRGAFAGKDALKVRRWIFQNAHTIAAFVAATPAERKKHPDWANRAHYILYAYGALVLLPGAQKLLHQGDHVPLTPGGSYRNTAGSALQAFVELQSMPVELWPFEDEESPFGKSS